jgi:putative endonuclease
MPRDYDFWVYIMTNKLDSVLYMGITNDLTRRVSEHQSGETPGFTADYRCHKLIFSEHYSDVQDAISREKATEGMVAQEESRADREYEPSLG